MVSMVDVMAYLFPFLPEGNGAPNLKQKKNPAKTHLSSKRYLFENPLHV